MIRDHLNKKEDIRDELYRRRPVFLVMAMVFIALTVLVYVFDDQIIGSDNSYSQSVVMMGDSNTGQQKTSFFPDNTDGQLLYALLLITGVFFSAFCVFCYRNVKFGNKLLGYEALDKVKDKDKSLKMFSTGFSFESGADEKKIATRRREGRATRRKYAKATREMQQQQAEQNKSEE